MRHLHRFQAAVQRAVAELARFILSPAVERAVRRGAACVEHTRRDVDEPVTAGYRSRRVTIGFRAVAEAAPAIEAPAVRNTIRRQSAGVIGAGRQQDQVEVANHGVRVRRVVVFIGAIAQLAEQVEPPATHRTGAAGARVYATRTDPREVEHGTAKRRLRDVARAGAPIAELAGAVVAPAERSAIVVECAGVSTTRIDRRQHEILPLEFQHDAERSAA